MLSQNVSFRQARHSMDLNHVQVADRHWEIVPAFILIYQAMRMVLH